MNVQGRTALITGATGGLGQAIARSLAARGASLMLTGRNEEVLTAIADELGAQALPFDLAKSRDVKQLADAAAECEILVCYAGLPGSGHITTFSVREIDRVIAVNLQAPMVLARLCGEQMMERKSGHIVFISSMAGKIASAGGSVYSAAKFGLRGFAFGLREDLHSHNVGVSCISPGFVRDAGMFHEARGDVPGYVGTSSPQDVCSAVIKAIEHNRAEITVAPLPVRAAGTVAAISPTLISRVQRRFGAKGIADRLAAGQTEKR